MEQNQIIWHEQYGVWSARLGTAYTLQVHYQTKEGVPGRYFVTVTGGAGTLRSKVGLDTPAQAQALAIQYARDALNKALARLGPADPPAAK